MLTIKRSGRASKDFDKSNAYKNPEQTPFYQFTFATHMSPLQGPQQYCSIFFFLLYYIMNVGQRCGKVDTRVNVLCSA